MTNKRELAVERLKVFASAAFVWLRRFLTPEFGRRTAICLFMLFLLLCECICASIFHARTHSVFNPFIQGAWFYLAVFGVSLLPGGVASRILLTFWLTVMGLVSVAGMLLYSRFGLKMNSECLSILAASSFSEAGEFLAEFMSVGMIVALILTVAVCGIFIRIVWQCAFRRSLLTAAVGILLAIPFGINCIRYTIDDEPERIYSRSNLPRVFLGYFVYRNEFEKLMRLKSSPQLPAGIRRAGGERGVLGLLVIGESASSNHWGLYGYPRDTTPRLSGRSGDCVVFDDVISAFPYTTASLFHMLTDAEIRSSRPAGYTLIDVLKAAGFRVSLISNQRHWGKYDSPVSILMWHCDPRIYIPDYRSDSAGYDLEVLPFLEREIESVTDARRLIIVQLMGSHTQFHERYPAGFSRFDGVNDECNRGMKAEHAKELNEYDNSIAYTDQVLGEMMKLLEKQPSPAFMLYISDHSEIGKWSGDLSRSPSCIAPDVYEIPCVLWTNREYRKAFPGVVAAAYRNRHASMQSDRTIWAVLTALGVTFDGFPAERDIFSPEYRGETVRMLGENGVEYHESAAKSELRKRLPERETAVASAPPKE